MHYLAFNHSLRVLKRKFRNEKKKKKNQFVVCVKQQSKYPLTLSNGIRWIEIATEKIHSINFELHWTRMMNVYVCDSIFQLCETWMNEWQEATTTATTKLQSSESELVFLFFFFLKFYRSFLFQILSVVWSLQIAVQSLAKRVFLSRCLLFLETLLRFLLCDMVSGEKLMPFTQYVIDVDVNRFYFFFFLSSLLLCLLIEYAHAWVRSIGIFMLDCKKK